MDLPEPKKRVPTPEEQKERLWNVATAFLGLVTFYVFLHKALIPLGLKLTTLRSSPYSNLDLWFFHPILLFLALREKKGFSTFSSFLAGGGIAYAAIELFVILKGAYPGWLGVTHFLSAAPFGAICIVLLSGPYPGKAAKWAWLGVLVAVIVKWLLPEIAKL